MKHIILTLAAAWALTLPLAAHHSFSAEFDYRKPVVLKGTLSRLEWINPHGWIYVDVKEPDGKVVTWAVETGGPSSLLRRGVRKTDFPIGAEVLIKGFQAKNGTRTANGRTVTLPDGRDLFFGSSGTGEPRDGAEKAEK